LLSRYCCVDTMAWMAALSDLLLSELWWDLQRVVFWRVYPRKQCLDTFDMFLLLESILAIISSSIIFGCACTRGTPAGKGLGHQVGILPATIIIPALVWAHVNNCFFAAMKARYIKEPARRRMPCSEPTTQFSQQLASIIHYRETMCLAHLAKKMNEALVPEERRKIVQQELNHFLAKRPWGIAKNQTCELGAFGSARYEGVRTYDWPLSSKFGSLSRAPVVDWPLFGQIWFFDGEFYSLGVLVAPTKRVRPTIYIQIVLLSTILLCFFLWGKLFQFSF
jgi:hypothetical protein